ncbi:hypothetical protein HNR46_003594 [Haloferula luteola]|uniref:Uncharacterized protein n=1 Tax=Haloferula luteola TaxID=595692 RepID=A0A840VFD7_9BACT|nr:hypothetical protein [Haloferula luteola]MBB5353338.1 hypothetical protein [Haloferula luteola]
MDSEFQRLEDQLKALVPAKLDSALLDGLAAALGDPSALAGDEVAQLEARLGRMNPRPPSAALFEKLAAPLERTPFLDEAKTVRFPVPAAEVVEPSRGSRFPWLAAAAAVAMAGAWTAVKMSPAAPIRPESSAGVPVAQNAVPIEQAPAADGHFQPASIDSAVSQTEDLGLQWNRQAQPMRVVRVTYMDRMKLLNEKGEVIETSVPRVEYVVIPEQVD